MNIACSNHATVDLLLFNHTAASNTTDTNFANKVGSSQDVAIKELLTIKGNSLQEVIKVHKAQFHGDFILDLDIEGKDLEVLCEYNLQSNPRPMVILIEDVPETEGTFTHSIIHKYLSDANYALAGRTAITSMYLDLNHSISTILHY